MKAESWAKNIFAKLLLWNFWGKRPPMVKVFGPKGAQNWSKIRFLRYYQNYVHGTLAIFCMNLQQHKGLKLMQMNFFGKNLALGFLDK